MAAIEPEKLELLRTALPKGLSAGDSGIGQLTGKTAIPLASWPQFQVTQSESKLYSEAPPPYTEAQTISSGGVAGVTLHPWYVSIRVNPDSDTYQYKVDYNSKLYISISAYVNMPITGLDYWNNFTDSGYIILSGVVSNGSCVSAEILFSNNLDDNPRIKLDDNVDQIGFSTILAYLYFVDGSPIKIQMAFNDFTLIDACSGGKAIIYPMAI